MKKSVMNLVKDLLIAVPMFLFGRLLLTGETQIAPAMQTFLCLAIAGIPFGWRWASTIITAVSLRGIGLKMLIAAFLGFLAMPIALGGDVIRVLGKLIKTCRGSRTDNRAAARSTGRSAVKNG